MVLCCHDEIDHSTRKRGVRTSLRQAALRECGTLLLVIGGFGIIDSVVKPQCEFDGDRISRQMTRLIEFGQALGDVLLVMVMALRFAVSGGQLFIPARRWHPPRSLP